MYTTFLLLFFQIFKVYSRYVSSSSVAGLCLFAKREVKSLSKVDWTSLCFFRMFLKWFTHLTSTKAQSLFISAVGMPLRSQRLKLFPVVQHFFNVTCWHSSLFIAVLLLWWALFIFLVSFLIQLLFNSSRSYFVTNIQTEKISSWNGPTVHVCCFMLARASTKTFVSRIHIR